MSLWKTAKDADGQVYYYNKKTRETTWDKPQDLIDFEASSGAPTPAPTPTPTPVPATVTPAPAPVVTTGTTEDLVTYKAPAVLDLPPPSDSGVLDDDVADTKVSGTCSSCRTEIRGPCFKAVGKIFHPKCFVCETGLHTLAPSYQFHAYNNKVYCPEHYVKVFEKTCFAKCGEIITEDFVQVGENYYHPHCWQCKECKKQLSVTNHVVFRGDFLCKGCHDNWLNQDKDLKAKVAHDKLTARLEAMKLAKTQPTKKESRLLGPGECLTFEELKSGKDLPTNIDTNKKEVYLSDSEFAKYIKHSRDEFEKMPKWKKEKIKKELGIF